MKPRYTDTLGISRRTKASQGPLHIGEDFLCLIFRSLRERRERPGLALHGSRADFIEDAVDCYGVEEVPGF